MVWLLAEIDRFAGGSPVLAVLAYADGNGGPTYPLPFPMFKGKVQHHGDRLAGLPTPFIRLGGA